MNNAIGPRDMTRIAKALEGIGKELERGMARIAKELEIIARRQQVTSKSETPQHDGCKGCRYEANDEYMMPCVKCRQNYMDRYAPIGDGMRGDKT